MAVRRRTTALAFKELRELLPLWSVTMAGLLAMALTDVVTPAALLALPGAALAVLAPVALGAMAMGHEFRSGTLPTLLALPTSRWRLLAAKLGAVTLLLAALAGTAWLSGLRTPWLWLPVACGLGLAPFFSLVTRSEVAGMIFAGAVPALLLLGGSVTAELVYGPTAAVRQAAEAMQNQILAVGTAVAAVAAFVGTVRLFLRLEAVETVQGAQVFGSRKGPSVRRVPSVVSALVRKELRLQLLPAAGAGVVLIVWTLLSRLPDAYGAIEQVLYALRPLLAVVFAMLVGATAGAEERHLRTWSSQILLPVPLWKQWAVKVAVVLTSAWVVASFLLGPDTRNVPLGRWVYPLNDVPLPVVAVLSAALSLYCSSLSRRSIVGFLIAAGAGVLAGFCSAVFLLRFGVHFYAFPQLALRPVIAGSGISLDTARMMTTTVSASVIAGVVATATWFGLDNYRRLQVPPRVVVRQVVAVVLIAALGLTIRMVAAGFENEVFRYQFFEARRAR